MAGVSKAIKAREDAAYQKELSLRAASQAGSQNKEVVMDEFGEPIYQFDPRDPVGTIKYFPGKGPQDVPANAPTPEEKAAGMSLVDRGQPQGQQVQSFRRLPPKLVTPVQSIANSFDNEQIVKNYNTATEGYNTVSTIGADTKSPADDIAFIYAFAKIMDPNSVVREGEYATIQKYAQQWSKSFGFKAQRIFSNTSFLSDDAKKKMLQALNPKIRSIQTQYNNAYSEYGRRINNLTGRDDGTSYLTDYSKAFGQVEPIKSEQPNLQSIKGLTGKSDPLGLFR